MAGMRSGHRFPLLKLVVPLGTLALWMCVGCAAKKADIAPPPPAPSQQVPPQTTAPGPPSAPGKSPATRGGAPGGGSPYRSGVGAPPAADLLAGPMFVHKGRYPGGSVSIIAGWYTGEIDNWKILAEANPGLNPNVIHEGMRINIPESMLKTREPMTREYVDSFYPKMKSKPKGTVSREPPSTPADEEPPLFGPKH